MNKVYSLLATGFGLGYLPKAPGTWGSLLGLPVGWYFAAMYPVASETTGWWDLNVFLIGIAALVVMSIFSYKVIKETEIIWNSHDDKKIVIDEIVGQAIPIMFLPPSWSLIATAFIFFRLFDIWKPWIIGAADRMDGPFGTLFDDILAGIFALAVCFALFSAGLLN
jgi:phosphatidylglycerophosphatase A